MLNVVERGIFRKKGILGINISLFKSFLQLILPIIRISTVFLGFNEYQLRFFSFSVFIENTEYYLLYYRIYKKIKIKEINLNLK